MWCSCPRKRKKVDVLTRVKKDWLERVECIPRGLAAVCRPDGTELRRLHNMHYMALFLTWMADLDVTRDNWKLQLVPIDPSFPGYNTNYERFR